MPSWLDLLMGGQAPVMAGPGQQPSPQFVPQTMVQAPVFAQAPQLAQDVAAGIADPLLKAGNYLGGIMQGSQQFSWPETIQHGAALAMAMAPGPKGERIAGGIERGLAGAAESAAPAGIRAYHGSPYDFPAFDISKIGTGEGAQAYGHGLYFAENEATAKAYRDALSTSHASATASILPDYFKPGNIVPSYGGGRDQVLDFKPGSSPLDFKVQVQEINQQGDPVGKPRWHSTPPDRAQINAVLGRDPGKMYEVNIKAQPEQFLDWDKPLSQQSPEVLAKLQEAGHIQPINEQIWNRAEELKKQIWDQTNGLRNKSVGMENQFNELHAIADHFREQGYTVPVGAAGFPERPRLTKTGQDFYSQLGRGVEKTDATTALQQAGIPGIKYLDQGSRGAGSGTSNYVVFNDKLIDILRKYGLIGMLGGATAAPVFAGNQGNPQQ